MTQGEGRVTSVDGNLMCSLCGCEWAEHEPFSDGEVSPFEGCLQAIGRRLAEVDVRTTGMGKL